MASQLIYSSLFVGVQGIALFFMLRAKHATKVQIALRWMQGISCSGWVLLHLFVIRASSLTDWLTANLIGSLVSILLLAMFFLKAGFAHD